MLLRISTEGDNLYMITIEDLELNNSQAKVAREALQWWRTGYSQVFEISGGPGTGKSYLIDKLVKLFGVNPSEVAPMAYTGSAAINMRRKGMQNAKTIFSWTYDVVEKVIRDENGKPVLDHVFNKPKVKKSFILKNRLEGIKLIIIDEGSMVPDNMGIQLESFGIPIIVAGDIDQLPTIFGKSRYLTDKTKVHMLTEIMRQNENSNIVRFSKMLTAGMPLPMGNHGDVQVIYEDEVTDQMISQANIVICGRNATRDEIINHVRYDMCHYTNKLPNLGERLVCRKNNWDVETTDGINLTNGLIGRCTSIIDPSCFNQETQTFKLDFLPDITNEVFVGLDVDYKYFVGDRTIKDAIMNTKSSGYGDKFEFGYAITAHMSQGSEFEHGIYYEEYLNKNINNKLHYVGLTRFKQSCIYVKRRPKNYVNGYNRGYNNTGWVK